MLPEQTQVVSNEVHGPTARLFHLISGLDHIAAFADLVDEILRVKQEKLEPAQGVGVDRNLVTPDRLVVVVIPQLRRGFAFLATTTGPGRNNVDFVFLEANPRRPGNSRIPVTRSESI